MGRVRFSIFVCLMTAIFNAGTAAASDDWDSCRAEHWKTASEWNAALEACSRTIKNTKLSKPQRAEAHYRLVLAVIARNDDWGHGTKIEEILPDLNRAIELRPNYSEAHRLRGDAVAVIDCPRAIKEYDAAIKLNSTDHLAFAGRATCNTRLDNHRLALADLDIAIQLHPSAFLYIHRALTHLTLHDRDRALIDYARAETMPNETYHPNLGRFLESQKTAKAQLEKLLRTSDQAQKRAALIIANSNYRPPVSTLHNPKIDAEAISASLMALGFDVTVATDLDRDGLRRSLRRFEAKLRSDPPDWAMVYFSGHGTETADGAFMLPVDILVSPEEERVSDINIVEDAVSVQNVLKRMQAARVLRLVIYDACRDNPALSAHNRTIDQTRQLVRGGNRATGMGFSADVVVFATSPGTFAMDGEPGQLSPFAKHFVAALKGNGSDLHAFFGQVAKSVEEETGKKRVVPQRPELRGVPPKGLYFLPAPILVEQK